MSDELNMSSVTADPAPETAGKRAAPEEKPPKTPGKRAGLNREETGSIISP